MSARRTEPSWSLLQTCNPREPSGYVHSTLTDIRVRFEQWRADAIKQETVGSVQESAIAEHRAMNIRSFKR